MMLPEEGNIIDDMASKRVIKWLMWPARGEYNGCGQKRGIQRMWPEEGNLL